MSRSGALDEATRESLQDMLLGFAAENRAAAERGDRPPYTVLIVTHELNEAILVSERVLGLSQYWDWQSARHTACPGATIVYDEPAPVYDVGDARDDHDFADPEGAGPSGRVRAGRGGDVGTHLRRRRSSAAPANGSAASAGRLGDGRGLEDRDAGTAVGQLEAERDVPGRRRAG